MNFILEIMGYCFIGCLKISFLLKKYNNQSDISTYTCSYFYRNTFVILYFLANILYRWSFYSGSRDYIY